MENVSAKSSGQTTAIFSGSYIIFTYKASIKPAGRYEAPPTFRYCSNPKLRTISEALTEEGGY